MKRKLIVILQILIAFSSNVSSQELEISGYYENHFFPQELNDKVIFQDYNKLRIDLSAEIGGNATFNGDYIYRLYHGAVDFNLLDFIPESIVAQYAEQIQSSVDSIRPAFDFKLIDENFLDNAYVTFYSEHANIRIGKQQLPWGTGYAWNPTDIFNAKNLLDPTYEKVGVNAYKLEIPFGKEGMLTGVVCIGDEWATSTKAIKAKNHFAGYDFSVSFVEKTQESLDYINFLSLSEKRRLWGADLSGEIFGLGVWVEGAYNSMKISEDFGQYLAGTDYTFENGLYLIGEYYRNGLGKSERDDYTFTDWMRLLSSDGENLGQDYLYAGEMYPATELLNWSNYLILNINDKSGMLFPWFDYSLNDNTEIIIVGYIPFGDDQTEFGEFGRGGFIRARVYF